MSETLISLKQVTFAYSGSQPVLRNVNLQVLAGDFLVILGANGAAKTTLLKIMLGFLKPQQGIVELSASKEHTHRGYIPQKSASFNPGFPATVTEVVGLNAPPHSKHKKALIEEALRRVELWDKKNSLLGTLSGGQLQRVLIAQAIISCPHLLFLDEPFTGLDTASQTDFLQLLSRLNKEGLTILMITHNFAQILQQANRFLVLQNGQLEEIDPNTLKVV